MPIPRLGRASLRRRERRAQRVAREERLRVLGIVPLPPGVGRSVEEVAGSIGRGRPAKRLLLDELQRDGIAEVSLGRWRLTPQAEAEFGVAFRSLLELQFSD